MLHANGSLSQSHAVTNGSRKHARSYALQQNQMAHPRRKHVPFVIRQETPPCRHASAAAAHGCTSSSAEVEAGLGLDGVEELLAEHLLRLEVGQLEQVEAGRRRG